MWHRAWCHLGSQVMNECNTCAVDLTSQRFSSRAQSIHSGIVMDMLSVTVVMQFFFTGRLLFSYISVCNTHHSHRPWCYFTRRRKRTMFYLNPDFSRLLDPQVRIDNLSQLNMVIALVKEWIGRPPPTTSNIGMCVARWVEIVTTLV